MDQNLKALEDRLALLEDSLQNVGGDLIKQEFLSTMKQLEIWEK